MAEALATLLSAARTRQSERAVLEAQAVAAVGVAEGERRTPAGAGDELLGRLLVEVRQREFLQEPIAFSPRPGIGRLLVLARKGVLKYLMRWYLHPVLEQQNAFNQAVSRLLGELVAARRSDRAG